MIQITHLALDDKPPVSIIKTHIQGEATEYHIEGSIRERTLWEKVIGKRKLPLATFNVDRTRPMITLRDKDGIWFLYGNEEGLTTTLKLLSDKRSRTGYRIERHALTAPWVATQAAVVEGDRRIFSVLFFYLSGASMRCTTLGEGRPKHQICNPLPSAPPGGNELWLPVRGNAHRYHLTVEGFPVAVRSSGGIGAAIPLGHPSGRTRLRPLQA